MGIDNIWGNVIREQSISTLCPLCKSALTPSCEGLIVKKKVPSIELFKLETNMLPMSKKGGKTRKPKKGRKTKRIKKYCKSKKGRRTKYRVSLTK